MPPYTVDTTVGDVNPNDTNTGAFTSTAVTTSVVGVPVLGSCAFTRVVEFPLTSCELHDCTLQVPMGDPCGISKRRVHVPSSDVPLEMRPDISRVLVSGAPSTHDALATPLLSSVMWSLAVTVSGPTSVEMLYGASN